MRTLAGGWEINDGCYTDTAPGTDRTPLASAEIEAFLSARGFVCESYAARISAEQCAANRQNGLYLCGKCTQERPQPQPVPATKRCGRPLISEVKHGKLCAGETVGTTGTGIHAESRQAGRQAGRQALPSPPDAVVMQIYGMVQMRLQRLQGGKRK